MSSDESPGTVLSDAECWKLLEHCEHGRLALSVAEEPDIYPINFLARQGLLLRTNPGTKLAELAVNQRVAFEADGIASGEAWGVVVNGTARILESKSEIDAANALPLRPWIRTRKCTYVEITPTKVTGRQFMFGSEPERY